MKNQKAFLTFVLCMISSFAAADSQTDAPLLPNDGNVVVAQTAKRDAKKAQNKKEKCAAKNVDQSASKPANVQPDNSAQPPQPDASGSY